MCRLAPRVHALSPECPAENHRLQPLIEALAKCVENLAGQPNPTSEAIWKLVNVLEEMEETK